MRKVESGSGFLPRFLVRVVCAKRSSSPTVSRNRGGALSALGVRTSDGFAEATCCWPRGSLLPGGNGRIGRRKHPALSPRERNEKKKKTAWLSQRGQVDDHLSLAPRATCNEAGTGEEMGKPRREVEELAELQRFPTDWLFRRLLRRARGLVSSERFDLLLERVTYELLAFGRLEEREVREVLRC